jgi:hypothetical protein
VYQTTVPSVFAWSRSWLGWPGLIADDDVLAVPELPQAATADTSVSPSAAMTILDLRKAIPMKYLRLELQRDAD